MNKIFIGNLPYSFDQGDLKSQFSRFGEIEDLFMLKDRNTGEFKGFGFITYSKPEAARAALTMNGQDFGGQSLTVSIARDK